MMMMMMVDVGRLCVCLHYKDGLYVGHACPHQ
jgi:hypothetical protein